MIERLEGMSKGDVAGVVARTNHGGEIVHLLRMAQARIDKALDVENLPQKDRQFLAACREEIEHVGNQIHDWDKEQPNETGTGEGTSGGTRKDRPA